MVTDLVARLPEMEAEAENLERRAKALRQVVEGIKALNGDANALLLGPQSATDERTVIVSPSPGSISGRDAVRRIVAERPGIWKVADLHRESDRRSYGVSKMGIEKAVVRLLESGEAVKVGYGRYRFGGAGEERLRLAE